MKQAKKLLCLFLFSSLFVFSQQPPEKTRGIFYKFSLASNLAINEDYGEEGHDDETLLIPSALFVNNTFGYQFDQRTSIGLNFEYNYHSKQGLHFFSSLFKPSTQYYFR